MTLLSFNRTCLLGRKIGLCFIVALTLLSTSFLSAAPLPQVVDVATSVDGNLYVATVDGVFVFNAKGRFLFNFAPSLGNTQNTITISEEGLVYLGIVAGGVNVYDLCGNFLFNINSTD